jgi:GT2 family glycosyltransferase
MIIVYHNSKSVLRIEGGDNNSFSKNDVIGTVLFNLAQKFPDEILVWCDVKWEHVLNKAEIRKIFHHKKMMVSFNPYFSNVINDGLGYVDNGSMLIINKEVSFCSWQMSSAVGAVPSIVLNTVTNQVKYKWGNFDYLLNSIAKSALVLGLFCYSEPELLKGKQQIAVRKKCNNYILFKFVRQHYHIKWIPVLFISFLLYEKKIVLFPLIFSLFFRKVNWDKNILDSIEVKSNKIVSFTKEIDVIIPTIGRKKYLYNVLCDLRNQSHLPKNIIVVEQNPSESSETELNFIVDEQWPFNIEHVFTHQAGACNARNIALSKVKSEWVFLNDDDNKIQINVIEKTLNKCIQFGIEAVVNNYPQIDEQHEYNKIHQTTIFGSGSSFVKSDYLKKVQFSSKYEFAYGEDFDFGMQLRNKGLDVIYLPAPAILHLKAPIGGFRIKPTFMWDKDNVVPRPSPTIMLNNLVYRTKQQLCGYKIIYYYKLFGANWFQNPIQFYKNTNERWNASILWANKLKDND